MRFWNYRGAFKRIHFTQLRLYQRIDMLKGLKGNIDVICYFHS